MVAQFSFIVVRGGTTIHKAQELMRFLYTILQYMDAIEVTEDTFDASYNKIPRVVVQHSEALRELESRVARGKEQAKAASLSQVAKTGDFKGIHTGQTSVVNMKQRTDPRFGIMDAHILDAGSGTVLVLNIAINNMTDFLVKTHLNVGLARKLNVGRSHDVIAVVSDNNSSKQVSFYETNTAGDRRIGRSVGGSEEDALGAYRTETGIDVGSVLRRVDMNVDISDAPDTIKQIDTMLVRMKESIDFMHRGGFDRPSIDDAKKEMIEVLKVRDTYSKLMGQKSSMITLYFKMNTPTKVRKLIDEAAADKLLELDELKSLSEVR